MIEELRIEGLGVIDAATLEVGPGLTVVTGETGAGKTMVLTGLGLLFGGRPDPGAVRRGRSAASVEGRVRLGTGDVASAAARVTERVAEAGGVLDDDVLVIARTVAAEGRSRAFLGGRSVPAAVLAEVGADLLVVHGQSDQQRLLRPALQREALDRFAGGPLATALAGYQAQYERLRAVEAELVDLTTRARERARETDLLRAGLAEIDAVAPEAGEDAALATEADRLSHAESLREAALGAHAALRGDEESGGGRESDALTLLAEAAAFLDRALPHDATLAAPRARLAEAAALLDDVAAELASYAAAVDTDPLRLAAVEERRAALATLRRRYGDTLDDVLAWAAESRLRLEALVGDDERIHALGTERSALREAMGQGAADLTALRRKAAEALAVRVDAELAALAMPHARLEVAVTPRPADPDGLLLPGATEPVGFGPYGVDEVELLLAAHAGAPARPLARGASGGELSRVMLALEVVLAASDPVPTFVFDEVDAGVGGRAAVEVGRRLARLARTAQVLVVTHLPQVAAFADRHLVVRKADDGEVTQASVTAVADEDRVRELARMLAGLEESDAAAAHAAELLALGAAEREAGAPAPTSGRAPRRATRSRRVGGARAPH